MSTRNVKLDELMADLRARTAIEDAFLAKSFTDRLLVVDVSEDRVLPEDLSDRITESGFRPAEKVYTEQKAGSSFAGDLGDATRHHFIDVHTHGTHQSYTVE